MAQDWTEIRRVILESYAAETLMRDVENLAIVVS